MEEEIWKDIPGYEGLYRISADGRILSLRNGQIRRNIASWNGYLNVQLSGRDHRKKRFYVHRLVAAAFFGLPPSTEHMVNHKNLDKKDNRVENLEWVTRKENDLHAYINGRTNFRKPMRKDNRTGYKGVSICRRGFQVSLNGKYVGYYSSVSEAAKARADAEKAMVLQ